MNKYVEGLKGEKIIRDYFIKHSIHFFQVDLMAKIANNWCVIEVKRQEVYEPPPFYGHGLPKWQIDARLNFQKEKNIRAILIIVDKLKNIIYWQYLDKLIEGKSYQTKGEKPRVIFPLENYEILK